MEGQKINEIKEDAEEYYEECTTDEDDFNEYAKLTSNNSKEYDECIVRLRAVMQREIEEQHEKHE